MLSEEISAMANDDATGGREHSRDLEEEYFRKQDRELVERMRKEAEAAAARRELGERAGLTDPQLISDLEALGFRADTVSLLPVMPVIQVAWAESGVSTKERKLVVDFARQRGIAEGSAADAQLQEWLNARPSNEVFDKATRLIRAMLAAGAEATHDLNTDDLVAYCERIAHASGGVFGIGSVSAEERAALRRIQEALRNP
jgi:ADP-ribose pyrophosphatase YjhB (NUDIX family)